MELKQPIIYMNGKASSLENIFEAINPKCWHKVPEDEMQRSVSDILDDWVNCRHTYYYINGIKTVFELK